ncbi:thiamine phosphate synthase [Phenylobacterium sp.]|uniref:thiamine phosphate synthase n=1 Tax=Phenylobacterium sp. TaxID=1871053 RepID=UPI002F3E39AA
MVRTAACLGRRARGRKPLPALLFFTDPARTPEPERQAEALPRGSAIIFRAFGAADALQRGLRLRAVARRRRLKLIVGADARLAAALGADGVHLPQRLAHHARRLKAARPGWVVTAAAHGPRAAQRVARLGADAVVISTAFPSRSPSAGAPLGAMALSRLARRLPTPLYALGGVNDKTARRLLDAGLVGLATVEGVETPRT